jgi:hypothetical protein
MPRTRKVYPMCGKKGLLKLSNHLACQLANVHKHLLKRDRHTLFVLRKCLLIQQRQRISRRVWRNTKLSAWYKIHINPETRNLFIIDDMMGEKDRVISKLFTKKSHHGNLSVIYIVQNLFHQSKEHRTISLNASYLCLN